MSIRLDDLAPCFEGVIPSIIATVSADGTPNISYLSHVVQVDGDHVALSNQFFAKTAANVRAHPDASLMIVDGATGEQYGLDITFVRSVDTGPLFDHISMQLKASSAQVGMADVMRLRSADIFRVTAIEKVPSLVGPAADGARGFAPPVRMPAVSRIAGEIAGQSETGDVIDTLLSSIHGWPCCDSALVMLFDASRSLLTTVGSIGYRSSGLGSEIRGGDGMIGACATSGRIIKVNDMSRVRRFGQAIAQESENGAREIGFPQLPDALSQIAVPMTVQGANLGVLFVESRRRLAFLDDAEAALAVLAAQAAAMLKLCEHTAAQGSPQPAAPVAAPQPLAAQVEIRVVHHLFDDSVFIENDYVIKGVAGRLLAMMIDRYIREGRRDFSNREIRLTEGLRLPDFKDNLETRLLLLRRRLDEKALPVRLVRAGRGRITLHINGIPVLKSVE